MSAVITTDDHPLRKIRRAGVPIAVFETSDPAQTILSGCSTLNGKAAETPVLQWDCVRGLKGIGPMGDIALGAITEDQGETIPPTNCLAKLMAKCPEKAIIWFHNPHHFIQDPQFLQALWLCRDDFKGKGITLIMMVPGMTIPEQLKYDVMVVSEPLPNATEMARITGDLCKDAGISKPDKPTETKIVDALLGINAYAAEQCLALTVTQEGFDLPGLWERKRKMIEQTPGLSVWRGAERFNDIGGCDNVKGFLGDVLHARTPPRCVCYIDEADKVFASSGTDTSGVSQDFLKCLLEYMQNHEANGIIMVGIAGTGKSALAKAAGNEGNIPTVALDLGGMKGSLVGESEGRLRAALKVIDAVSQGQTLFIAACNSITTMPPELRRRFNLGIVFFDLPDDEERKAIWDYYRKKYSLEGDTSIVDDLGWSGSEIKACAYSAWQFRKPLAEAAKRIVPISKSSKDLIEAMRKSASGKYLSANKPGLYQFSEIEKPAGKSRRLEVA